MISVLLVDDEPALLDVTQIFLERDAKMRVTLSESAKDALQKLAKSHFDIIVADYEMPQMNGIDFLREVKASGYDIPFIIFTGRGREHVAIEALNLGASFYLQKGGDPKAQFAELRNMILQAVQKKRAEEEVRANQLRLQAVIDLYQMSGRDTHDLCMYALEKAIVLSGSRMGFLAFLNEQETVLKMYAWSQSALEICRVRDRCNEYHLEKTGLWGEPVRQRRVIITNDYSSDVSGKKGFPEGHPPLTRFMGVPIQDGSRIVMVIGLANKEADYTETDAQQVTLLMGSLWQVLSRKRVETELVASEKRFRSYFELPLAGLAIAAPDLRWVQVNQKFCQMLGYTESELCTLSWTDLTPPDDRGRELERFSRVVSGEKQSLTLEKRFQRKDGSLLEVEVSAIPVRKATGEVDYFVTLVNDISDLKRTERELLASNEQMSATLEELRVTQDSLNEYCHRLEREEKALRQSETRFRKMVETAPSLLLILDREGEIVYVSPHTFTFTGYTPEEFLEIGFDIVDAKDTARVKDAICNGVKTGTGFRDLEFRARRKDGGKWYASGSLEPLQDEKGSFSGFLVQIMDISSLKEAEHALMQSREKLRELVETINDAVFSLDEEGKITYISPAVTRILGYDPQDLTGRMFSDLLQGDNLKDAIRGYDAFRGGELKSPLEIEWQILSHDGEMRWCRLSLWPLEKDGHFSGCTGTLTDIHDRKMALEELRTRERLLQGIFRAAPLGIGLVRDRILLYVNEEVCRMTGYSRDELVGKSSRCLYPSEDEFQRIGREMESRLWETGGEAIESRWVRKDGSEIVVLISTSPIDPDVSPSTVVFSVMDISEQKAKENALQENEQLLRSFFHAIPGPAFLIGERGEIITANEAFWALYAGGVAHPPGTPLSLLLGPEMAQKIGDYVSSGLGPGSRSRFEIVHGSSSFLVDVCPVRDSSGKFSRAAVFFSEISDYQKAQENLAQYNRRLSLLSRVTRHEAAYFLSSLRGYLDRVERQTDDPLILTYIHKKERYLADLEKTLLFTEEYPGSPMHSLKWQDVNSIIKKVSGMYDLRNVTIYLDCEGLSVLADPLLEKVFSALIRNSLRDSRVTRISFSLRKEGSGLVLVCEDNGSGIAPEQKEAIFEERPGEDVDPGLYFTREILSMMGFFIRESGNPGEGSRFEIEIPAGSFRISSKDT